MCETKKTHLCNLRGISGSISATQTHFEIIPLHEYHSPYWPVNDE